MPLNPTPIFIREALDALGSANLNEEQQESLCDKLIELCHVYVPGKFVDNKKFEEDDEY